MPDPDHVNLDGDTRRCHGPPVGRPDAGQRLDAWLSGKMKDHSRAQWQELIRTGRVTVNGQVRKPSYELRENDRIEIEIPAPRVLELVPEDIPLDVLFEDRDVLVLNKPPGLVVHPAPGHWEGTLVNALLHHCKDLEGIGGEMRPGIVHRLDKDTSGVMVIAKNDAAMHSLAQQFKKHRVQKQYVALVLGQPKPPEGTIRTLLGRSPHNRKKMSARVAAGREAITHYETVQALGEAAYLRIRIETGRTHQIRVHFSHLGHPVLGDREYGRAHFLEDGTEVARQMLHAERLSFTHPRTHLAVEFNAPLPDDMRALLKRLSARK